MVSRRCRYLPLEVPWNKSLKNGPRLPYEKCIGAPKFTLKEQNSKYQGSYKIPSVQTVQLTESR